MREARDAPNMGHALEAEARPRMREFFAPLPLVAVALLALNDHFLKARFHNLLTGKLSDLAICFFMPLFLSASLEPVARLSLRMRLTAGTLATVTIFAALKLSPAADRVYCRALDAAWSWAGLRFHAVADATDLVCLPLVAAAFFYAERKEKEGRR